MGTFFVENGKNVVMKSRLIILFAMSMALCSCSTLKNYFTEPGYILSEPVLNDKWQGCSYADIVRAYGAPTRTASDGAGGTIYVYEEVETEYSTSSSRGVFDSIDTTTKAKANRNFTEFYVNADNSCYQVRSNLYMPDGSRKFSVVKTGFWTLTACCLFGMLAVLYD